MRSIVKIILFSSCLLILPGISISQDTSKSIKLNEIEITPIRFSEIERMGISNEQTIYSGKKNEVISLDKINADLSINNSRQVFAKVPGMSVWENDGSGIQVGVAARGLSPNRSWEFNVRQNGYDISSDPFGYPEAYYTPPMEALEKIEVIRGSASLQFGPQFGGVINYRLKKPNANKKISFEGLQTIGSYGLFCTYNALGGTIGKFSYYGFIHHRTANGWRENSYYKTTTGYLYTAYQLSNKIKVSAEYTGSDFLSQQPGGLTDAQYEKDHRQSMRERNWFSAPWNVASLQFEWKANESFEFKIKTFATIAERNSVGFTKAINIADTVNTTIGNYNPRQVDRDAYNNLGAEGRMLWKFMIKDKTQVLAAGVRFFDGNTKRNQSGVGNNNSDFDLNISSAGFGKSLTYATRNYSVFAEQVFQIGKKLKIVPGVRYEIIENSGSGYINTTTTGNIQLEKRNRSFLLYGIGSEFNVSEKTNLYANYSRAYRPVTFSELTPSATTDIIDPNLKDASGFNADFGYRGTIKKFLSFDVGAFYLLYENRIGSLNNNGIIFRTNIGTSVSKGVESYIEINPVKFFTDSSKIGDISLFASNSFIDAQYVKWENPEIAADPLKSINGKRVENAPQYIHRFGLTYNFKTFSFTYQLSSVGDVFTDAANTILPNSSATIGKLSGYEVMDLTCSFTFAKNYVLKGGVNNLTDAKYATRRSGGYPGPGILPGNGRTFYLTIGVRF
jgi:Fe(3+) dicitrate transport protein